MIDRIIAGTATEEDIAQAQAYDFDERRKLIDKLLGSLEVKFDEALRLEGVLEDVSNALAKARPVFAAGLSVDQALGFITKMIQDSLDELAESGAQDSDDYERQEQVLETLQGFVGACEAMGGTQGEDAQDVVHLEYRGEVGRLESLKNDGEAGIANTVEFLRKAYGEGSEYESFGKSFDKRRTCVRFVGTFGSPSYFAYKHIAKPGESSRKANEKEGD